MSDPVRPRLWKKWRNWRRSRLIRKVVYASAEAMLAEAGRRRGVKLAEDDQSWLVRRYAVWLMANDERLIEMIDRPERLIHLFLSEVF